MRTVGDRELRITPVRDVSYQKNTQKKIERKYRNLVEGSPDLISLYSNKRGGIYYSKRVEDVLGYSPSYLLDHPTLWHNSIHPDDREKVNRRIDASEKGQGTSVEYRIKDAKGNWLWFLDRFIAKDEMDGEILIEGLATDITERKEIDKALVESKEQAEKANEMKDKFVSLVAHDLRSPANTVSSLLKLLLMDGKYGINETQREIISAASDSCAKMSLFVEEILNMNRIKAGNLTIKRTYIRTNDMVEEIVKNQTMMLSNKGISVYREIMAAHEGSITLETAVGKGSTFSLHFSRLKPLILLVDDEKMFRIEQKSILSETDVDFMEACNGEEALQIIEKIKPDLLITDITMPVMDGFELLEKVKNNKKLKSIPVMVGSSLQSMEFKNEVFKKGANDFVSRPFDPEDFLPRVKRFLE